MRAVGVLLLLLFLSETAQGTPVYAASIIVKNEETALPRLLESLRPYVSHYVICDTGSTDNTIKIANDFLQRNKKGGTVHSDEWRGFSFNRNKCLQRTVSSSYAEGIVTHILLMDADFELLIINKTDFERQGVEGAHGLVQVVAGQLTYRQPLVLSLPLARRCGYVGVTHEYLTCVDTSNAYRLILTKVRACSLSLSLLLCFSKFPAGRRFHDKGRARAD
jgi:glycosyltransferase involved in cell wall biosynthesis